MDFCVLNALKINPFHPLLRSIPYCSLFSASKRQRQKSRPSRDVERGLCFVIGYSIIFPVQIDKSALVEVMKMRLTFRTQIIVTMILVIVGFISSLWFNKDMYYNLAWVFTGLIFFINPVYQNITSLEKERAKKGIRIAGMILVFIGLTNGFGV